MIRVLAISNAYLELFTRPGIIDTKRYPEFEVTAVVPRHLAEKNPAGFEKLAQDCSAVRKIDSFFNYHHSVRAYSAGLLKVLKEIRPDVIFINNEPWSTTVFETVLLCRMGGLKSKIAVYTCENLRRKYVFPFWLFEKYVFRNVDTIVTLTREEGAGILRLKGYNGRIHYLPLSVDPERFRRSEGEGPAAISGKKGRGKLVFGFIGRLVREKGIDVVLHALKELDDNYHFVVIGSGPYKDELQQLASEWKVDTKVTFIDNLFHDELPKYINSLDCVVLPSLTTANWKEQFGRVLIEAMACEVPVIGSSSGEIPEVVGEGGVIFREGDAEDLKTKLIGLNGNPGDRTRYGRNGRKRVLEKYAAEVVMARTAQIYKELISDETAR